MSDGRGMIEGRGSAALRFVVATFFLLGGIGHLAVPDKFLAITPGWVPAARETIIVTGILEIAGAIGLFVPRLRWAAGVGLALYTLCVWPANVKHAIEGIALPPIPDSWWYHGPRLVLQPVIIWATLYAGRVVDWPFAARR